MKFKLLFLLLTSFYLAKTQAASASENKIYAQKDKPTLDIDQEGTISIKNANWRIKNMVNLNRFFGFTLRNTKTHREFAFVKHKLSVEKSRAGYSLRCVDFSIENDVLPIDITLFAKEEKGAFHFSGEIKNESDDWIIQSIDYKFSIAGESPEIFWPYGLGEHIKDPRALGTRHLQYPSGHNGTMPWFTLNNGNTGVYIGSHNPNQQPVDLRLSHLDEKQEFVADISISLNRTSGDIPNMVVYPYTGRWHQAAKYFREWYDSLFTVTSPPEWVIDDTGWLLAILKQQDGEIMWKYSDLDKLCDIAEQHNLTSIGLFGWTHGGHDRFYPNYVPSHLMGGRAVLRDAIKRAQKRGIKVILYANGKIMDTSTDYYNDLGIETMLMKKNLAPDVQFYIKQRDATPVIFAQACIGSEIWRKTMVDLAFQALSLGADGILYDQIGILEPIPCFSHHHDHLPGESDTKSRMELIKEISEKTKGIRSDFIVMTEGLNAVISKDIDYTHGLGKASHPSPNAFPELFRYTFPEFIVTQRNPSPVITRTDMNYAIVYGLRHEIESRYTGDVKYLLTGKLDVNMYRNVVSPPDLSSVALGQNENSSEYVYSTIGFEKKNADLFYHGKFTDEVGITIDSEEDVIAKGFVNGSRMGVVVWNKSLKKAADFKLSVVGFRLKGASDPKNEIVEPFSAIEPNSIRLLFFEK